MATSYMEVIVVASDVSNKPIGIVEMSIDSHHYMKMNQLSVRAEGISFKCWQWSISKHTFTTLSVSTSPTHEVERLNVNDKRIANYRQMQQLDLDTRTLQECHIGATVFAQSQVHLNGFAFLYLRTLHFTAPDDTNSDAAVALSKLTLCGVNRIERLHLAHNTFQSLQQFYEDLSQCQADQQEYIIDGELLNVLLG